MARFHASWKTTGAGSSTLPIGSIFATAGVRPRLVEVSAFNTTGTAVELQLIRFTALGTAGSTITSTYEEDASQTSITTAKDTHTVAPTKGGIIRQVTLGASAGSGIIYTFGKGLIVPNTTGDGIGWIPVGTGQICDVSFTWDE